MRKACETECFFAGEISDIRTIGICIPENDSATVSSYTPLYGVAIKGIEETCSPLT